MKLSSFHVHVLVHVHVCCCSVNRPGLALVSLAIQETPPGSQRLNDTSANTPTDGEVGGAVSASPVGNPRTWLVLYCGANAKVEKVRKR